MQGIPNRTLRAPVTAMVAVVGLSSHARAEPAAAVTLTPDLFSVEVREGSSDGKQEARFRSGLGLELRSELLKVSVDYKVESKLSEDAPQAAVSQRFGASLESAALNEFLGFEADIKAGSTIAPGGDGYVYSITPGLSTSLSELGDFSFQYEYLLDNPGARSVLREKMGYRMDLAGTAQGGRLSWKGNYRSTDVYGGVDQLQSTELIEFESRYQLAPALQVRLSGRSRDDVLFDDGRENDGFSEVRYGAGLAWSPSRHYSLAFKVNKRDESRDSGDEVFGSGTFTWAPERNMAFTVSYGDHLVDGARGVLLRTRLDLNDS